jgi:hypothetical protein
VLVDLGRAVVYLLTSACGMHAAEMQQRPYLAATKLLVITVDVTSPISSCLPVAVAVSR